MSAHKYLKNTVSGVVEQFDTKTADRYLKLYAGMLVEVDSPKNEVLAQPYVEEGSERVLLTEPAEHNVTPAKSGKKDK